MEQIQGTQEKTSGGTDKIPKFKKKSSSFGSPTRRPKVIYLFIYIFGQWASFILA
jgi:hypothetical protein